MEIWDIKRRIRNNRNAIEQNNDELKRVEKAYDSLTRFKTKVLNTQDAFSGANGRKCRKLENVKKITDTSLTAEKYYSGMNDILNNVGVRLLNKVFNNLISSITAKISSYKNSVNDLENANSRMRVRIAELELMLREEEEKARIIANGGMQI